MRVVVWVLVVSSVISLESRAEVFNYSLLLGDLEASVDSCNWGDCRSELRLSLLSDREIYSTHFFVIEELFDWKLTLQIEGLLNRPAVFQDFFQESLFSKDGINFRVVERIEFWQQPVWSGVNCVSLNLWLEPGRLTYNSCDYCEFVSDHQYGSNEPQFRATFDFLFCPVPEPTTFSFVLVGIWWLILSRRRC